VRFEFGTAARIIFGPGTAGEFAPLAAQLGGRALVVTGGCTERAGPVLAVLEESGVDCSTFSVPVEPTPRLVDEGLRVARDAGADLVVGVGGGSVIDAGKAIAAMLRNPGRLEDYLEVVGRGRQISCNPVPYIAIPTTSGTGSEVTKNAVLRVPEYRVKVSMRGRLMLPRLAVVDPELTYSMRPGLTAATGLDALTQLMEAYVCRKASPLTDCICREGLRRAGRSLKRAFEDPADKAAREDMSLASLFGGLALSNSGLGAVHGLAGPLGGLTGAPHGMICAALVAFTVRLNIETLESRAPGSPTLKRYDQIAELLSGKAGATALEGVDWLERLCSALKVPCLSELGLAESDFAEVVAGAQKSSSMKGNPVELSDEELVEVLRQAF